MFNPIFVEDFTVSRGSAPANWEKVKYSANTPEALVVKNGRGEMIVSGDCYMPILGELADGKVEIEFTVAKYDPALFYMLRVDFRYDAFRRRGLSARLVKTPDADRAKLCYGTLAENVFTSLAETEVDLAPAELAGQNRFAIEFSGDQLTIEYNAHAAKFSDCPAGSGRIALGRGNFFDIVRLNKVTIFGSEPLTPAETRKLHLRVNPAQTSDEYPVFADLTLTEYADFFEAELTLSGGSHLSPAGEGNYHVMRFEKIVRPYLKVITATEDCKYTLYDGTLMLHCKEIAPVFHYGTIYPLPEWPFSRKIRFVKPQGDFLLAVGGEEFFYGNLTEQKTTPAETVFTRNGEVLFTDFAVLEKDHLQITLNSPVDPDLAARIPKDDPRYDRVMAFLANNHYFLAGRELTFEFAVTGYQIPAEVEIRFEDAFLRDRGKIDAEAGKVEIIEVAKLRTLQRRNYRFTLPELPVGVYHLALTSLDPTLPGSRRFAFEVMPRDAGAPTAAETSGLPTIHTCFTETRGLDTDGFDPYRATPGNIAHYVSICDFLPWFARKYHLVPTLHAFGRRYYAWLGSRCTDAWHIAENRDLLKDADYAHIGVELQMGGIFGYYRDYLLQDFIAFAESSGDAFYDVEKLKKLAAAGERCPDEYLDHTISCHWPQWADFASRRASDRLQKALEELRRDNPKLKFAKYGPAAIYGSCYRGAEMLKYMCAYYFRPDQVGFLLYEDYPESCDYLPHRGSFFLGTIAMTMPELPLTPELYSPGTQGCPDGAVFFAHPPFGLGTRNIPPLIKNRMYEYVYATAYWDEAGFGFWNRFGFQLGLMRFEAERTENFLRAWGNIQSNLPVAPLRSSAYVYSWDSWLANDRSGVVQKGEEQAEGSSINVLKTATESIPFCAEASADAGVLSGFQLHDGNLEKLIPENVDILFLPPIAGIKPEVLAKIRQLYAAGVSLVTFENVGELADLFGVVDTGKFTPVTQMTGTPGFLPEQKEFIADARFGGRYAAAGAEVLISGETPVLFAHSNGKATAYFFNAPPTASIVDMLPERFGSIGRMVMSQLMKLAVAEIHRRSGDAGATTDCGRLIGAKTADGAVLVVSNFERYERPATVTFRKLNADQKLVSCDAPHTILAENEAEITIRVRLRCADTAFMIFK